MSFLLAVISAAIVLFSISVTEGKPSWKPASAALLFVHGGGQTISSVVIGTTPGSNACNGTGTGSTCTWPNTQNNSSTTGSEPYNYIGTLSAVLSAGTPPYSGSYTLLSGTPGGNCAGHTFDNTHFSVSNGDLVINSSGNAPVAGTTYYVCIVPVVGATTTNALALTILVYNFIDAAGTYCASHGGGNGSTGSPWTDACIAYAISQAGTGDTVFLAAGNWALNITGTNITISKTINLVGAASGNTFDVYGHPNNGFCSTAGSDACLPAGFTRIYTTGSNQYPGPAGFVSFASCSNDNVAHIFSDGSLASSGGNSNGTLNFNNCPGSTVNDIRVWSYQSAATIAETQFYIYQSNNTSVTNSIFAASPYWSNTQYSGGQIFQSQEQNIQLVKNNMFWEYPFNGFYMDNVTFSDNTTYQMSDPNGNGSNAYGINGYAGCTYGPVCRANGGTTGSYHDYYYNNYLTFATRDFMALGGGINDPPNGGGVENDIQLKGNWIIGRTAAIDSCGLHLGNGCPYGSTSGSEGPQLNLSGNGYSFISQNNSIIGSVGANLTATGSGCTSSGQGAACSAGNETQTINFNSTQNYLQSPSNLYNTDAGTITPTVTGNFCDNASHSSPTFFAQTDSTNCATAQSAWTTAPTCTFTLGPLTGSIVPITATTFTAQFGAVQYIAQAASSPPSTPTSGDARWNYSGNGNGGNQSYIPPYSLAASHGQTVYMWVMDNAATPHIAACTATGSALVY